LRLRLLGDRVLQSTAWRVAEQLGWDDTFAAEYIALTQLQADALITLDKKLAGAAKKLVTVAKVDDLLP
jgi:predicted nucleic acid-binding protein